MKIKIKVEREFEVQNLRLQANVRYWEDASVNGKQDGESGDLIPCREENLWAPVIDIETGKIENWPQGTTANIHYKVVDQCGWELRDENDNVILYADDGYVPDTLCPKEEGYGDYIIMDIDENGVIADWKFNIDDFQTDED